MLACTCAVEQAGHLAAALLFCRLLSRLCPARQTLALLLQARQYSLQPHAFSQAVNGLLPSDACRGGHDSRDSTQGRRVQRAR